MHKHQFCRYFLALLAATTCVPSSQAATLTRTSAFTYDPANGLLLKEIVEPDDSNLCLVTEYIYDKYGNKTSATTRNCDGSSGEALAPAGDALITSRSVGNAYDASRHQFPTTSTNAAGHSEIKTYDARFGAVSTLTGPNGLTTAWAYDRFGRKVLEKRADGTGTKLEYRYCTGTNGGTDNCPTIGGAVGAYVVVVTPVAGPIDMTTLSTGAQNGPIGKTYYDALNREIRSETQGYDGAGPATAIYKDTQYDSLGRTYKVSRPYSAGATAYWTEVTVFDSLGRVVQEKRPDDTLPNGTITTTAYNGLSVTVTNAKSQTSTTERNSQGQIARVTDAAGKSVSYAYDPFGNLTRTTDAVGNVTLLRYDLRGRKFQMQDPDMGTWIYAYNALGELIRQTDAKGQTSTIQYDVLGRMTRRSEADLISTWAYDACSTGIGKLCVAAADNGYQRTHSYDSLGRPVGTTSYYDGSYSEGVAYENGRISVRTWPSGFAVRYAYTPLGYLKEISNNATNVRYWRGDGIDAEGRVTNQVQGGDAQGGLRTLHDYSQATGRIRSIAGGSGNGVLHLEYQYDSLGNITQRKDNNQNLIETFSDYDNLNRLRTSTVSSGGAGIVTKNYAYDDIGNIVSRSDLGTYAYSGAGNARPHALAQVDLYTGGKRTYDYDPNGNLTVATLYDAANNIVAAETRSEYYTSFNMPYAMGRPGVSLRFKYGAEHQRVDQVSTIVPDPAFPNNVVSTTTYYVHPGNSGELFYEKDLRSDGTEERHFISAYGQVVALVRRTNGTTWNTRYLHRDNLGSVVAVTDEAGTVVERFAYEPFGKRRFPSGRDDASNTIVSTDGETYYGWPETPPSTGTQLVSNRGFTNHEHLDELGLVHMNGRIYDPVVGRFMSPDPNIPSPGNLQNYNRYSYVLNNPLLYTDPSGYCQALSLGSNGCIRQAENLVSNTVNRIVDNPEQAIAAAVAFAAGDWAATSYFASTASAAAAAATVAETTLTAAEVAGMWTTAQIIGGAVGGFAGGFVASGGDFQAGLYGSVGGGIGGGISGYFGSSYPLERVAANSLAGGINSKLRGGSFADGARTAFGYSALAYLNVQMRNQMVTQSKLDARNDGTGLSRGMFGDLFKLAGGRWSLALEKAGEVQCSLLGCLQSGPGSVFGVGYSNGGFVDMVVESFAGPHDKANSYWFYDPTGLNKEMSKFEGLTLDLATNYTTSLLFAAPFAAGAIYEQTNASAYSKVRQR